MDITTVTSASSFVQRINRDLHLHTPYLQSNGNIVKISRMLKVGTRLEITVKPRIVNLLWDQFTNQWKYIEYNTMMWT